MDSTDWASQLQGAEAAGGDALYVPPGGRSAPHLLCSASLAFGGLGLLSSLPPHDAPGRDVQPAPAGSLRRSKPCRPVGARCASLAIWACEASYRRSI